MTTDHPVHFDPCCCKHGCLCRIEAAGGCRVCSGKLSRDAATDMSAISGDLETALCLLVKLAEMAKEFHSEKWGREVWFENASEELVELRGILDNVARKVV